MKLYYGQRVNCKRHRHTDTSAGKASYAFLLYPIIAWDGSAMRLWRYYLFNPSAPFWIGSNRFSGHMFASLKIGIMEQWNIGTIDVPSD